MVLSVPDTLNPSDEEIALGAYRIWLQEGCPSGRDKEHWLKAKEQLVASKAKENESKAGEENPAGDADAGTP